MTPAAYQTLPTGPININSSIGKQLRKETISQGFLGTPVKEVYKGWKRDYALGERMRKVVPLGGVK